MDDNWKNRLKGDPLPWLLQSPPWTKYRAIIDLLGEPRTSKQAMDAKEEMRNDPDIKALIEDTGQWFPNAVTRHNDPKLSHYKFRVLSDFGLTIDDHGMNDIIKKACRHTETGLFSIRQELPQKGKGHQKPNPGADEWHALPCDSPLIAYTLLCMEHKTEQVLQSVDTISAQRQIGVIVAAVRLRAFSVDCPVSARIIRPLSLP